MPIPFLRDCIEWFRKFLAQVGLSAERASELARFLTSRQHFDKGRNTPKPAAFLPKPNEQGLSVFRIDGLVTLEIRELGATNINVHRIFGYATVTNSTVMELGLRFDPDERPPRHGNLTGWPPIKEERLSIAQVLARRSVLSLYAD